MSAPESAALLACTSCRTERPEQEMRHPLSPSWVLLPDLWECRDRDACWEAVRHG